MWTAHFSLALLVLTLRHKPATDIRKSAQPASTPYPASTNKEPPRHLLKQPSHASCYGVLIVDCAPDSKKHNMKRDLVVLRDASEAPCS